jgi:hypothetical protein
MAQKRLIIRVSRYQVHAETIGTDTLAKSKHIFLHKKQRLKTEVLNNTQVANPFDIVTFWRRRSNVPSERKKNGQTTQDDNEMQEVDILEVRFA